MSPRFSPSFRRVAACAAGAVTLLAVSTSFADVIGGTVDDTDWRQESRPGYHSKQSWEFQVRFGPYRPRIDEEFSAAPGPYERVFGTSSRVFFGLELDYQALRIPHVGTLGPGVGWGYTSMSAKAKIRGTSVDSAESTSLWIMPFYTVGVLNIDVLARDFGIPLVPYGKLGVGYSLWKAANDLGISTYDGVSGKGHSYGLHYAFGGMVQLDFLNRHSSSQLDDATGINHSYFYMEWVRSNLDGFGSGKHMQVGTSTWVTGLAFEI